MITGTWYPAGSSAKQTAELDYNADHYSLHLEGGQYIEGRLSDMEISPRLGSIPRELTLADGSVFQTLDNQGVDLWLKLHGTEALPVSWAYRLEHAWPVVVCSAIFMVFFGYALLKWIMPWSSHQLAHALPVSVTQLVGETVLESLDDNFLLPSQLSSEQQESIRQRFDSSLRVQVKDEHTYRLSFRRLKAMPDVANAFALPSGDIVLTDELVKILTPQELDSVLLHEMGHVYHRHGMQRVIHSSLLSFLALAVVGNDGAFLEEMVISLPVFLMNQHYSREAEMEADAFAFKYLAQSGVKPKVFAQALTKITKGEHEHESLQYLSTHPATSERIKHAHDYN